MNAGKKELERLTLIMNFMHEVTDRKDLGSDFSVRAMYALGEGIADVADDDERHLLLINAAVRLLSDDDATVTDNIALLAAAAKGNSKDAPFVLSELENLFHHGNHWVAYEALTECNELMELANDSMEDSEKFFLVGLCCGLNEHKFPGVRATAARTLGTIASKNGSQSRFALAGLARYARDPEDLVREAAMRAAEDIALSQPEHAAQALEILGRRVRDREPVFRHSAVKIACAIGRAVPEQAEKALRIVFHGLKDEEDYVRNANVTEFARFARDVDLTGHGNAIHSLRTRFNHYAEGKEDAKTRRELAKIDRRIGGILKEFARTPAPAA